tara:strand:- start:28040 stop:28906 length:867 start_codon:yes stop_codon:yes gene_type:complete
MKNKIIILGSSGFIGKAISDELRKTNKNFLGFSSTDINLLLEESILKLNNQLIEGDIVIFVSALAPCKDQEMYKKNIMMINNFFSLIELKKIKHFLYISSDAVYEDSKNLISENNKKSIDNFHAKMHVDREKIITSYCYNEDINLTIVRPTLVYGPGDTHNGYGPNKFIRDINSKKNIILFGKGEEKRDHIYICDLVNIIIEILEKNIYGSYTLATGKVISFYEIAKIVCNLKDISYDNIEFSERIGPMPHNGYRAFDISKIKSKISNFSFTDLDEALKISIKNLFYL